jgi:uncharacterized membrane protein
VKFCPSCGAAVKGKATTVKGKAASTAVKQSAPAGQKAGSKDAEENKVMAILAYILFFIPLLTGDHKKSPFVKFHANQGTVLFLASIIFGIAFGIVYGIIVVVLLVVGAYRLMAVIGTILGLLWLAPLVLCILGIVNAATGKMKPLPVIGRFTIIK